jgi:hypothetical protein
LRFPLLIFKNLAVLLGWREPSLRVACLGQSAFIPDRIHGAALAPSFSLMG